MDNTTLPTADQCDYMTCSCTDGCKRVYAKLNLHSELAECLEESRRQIEYLHEKFSPTGSGDSVLNRIDAILAKAKEVL